jgi:HPt (histidine-containing phosphotransfer) domain-containing protein
VIVEQKQMRLKRKLHASPQKQGKEKEMKLACEALDRSLALAAVGGDTGFLAELAGIFEAACPTLLDRIQRALATGDLVAAAVAARLVRAVADNVAAKRVASVALECELLARQRSVAEAQAAHRALLEEVERILPVLDDLKSELDCSE